MSLADKIRKRSSAPAAKKNAPRESKIMPSMNVSTVERTKRSIEIFNEENKLPLYRLTSIEFGVFSSEIFDKKKVTDVTEINRNMDPYFTIEDPRLGTIQNYRFCSFCGKTTEECTGHFAKINLNFNFIHPSFRLTTIHVLNCICHTCNRLIISEDMFMEKGFNMIRGNDRLTKLATYSIKTPCSNPNCGLKITFKTSKIAESKTRAVPYYIKKDKGEEERYMSVDKIKKKLSNLTDTEVKMLGFENTHPKNFIMDYIPILPMTDRPPAFTDNEKKDHSFTFAYNEILSKHLESIYQEDTEEQEECYRRIIFIFQHIIDNKKGEYTRNQSDVVGSFKDELVGKAGIIRSKMLGKRSDYTARTVIGPNKTLNFGYVAPPEAMKKVTIPEIITRYNYDYVIKLANEGRIKYFCPDKGNLAGRKIRFDYNAHKSALKFGDRIERESQNGDIIIFNRQPTLQKQSMLGYIAQFQDKQSIGIHLSSCEGLNADFDGDEGNEHFLQTVDSQVEARLIMHAPNCIISLSSSKPVASMVFNAIASAYMITDDATYFEQEEFDEGKEVVFDLSISDYARNNYETLLERLDDIDPLSGKALFSILLPPDFWYSNDKVLISNGVLRRGKIKSSHIGGGANSIVQSIYKWYGKQAAADFISAASFLLNWYIYKIGFTLSFKDATLREHEDEFRKNRADIVDSVDSELLMLDPLPIDASALDKEERESEIKQKFAVADDKIKKEVANLLDKSNSIFIMIDSGAKGKMDNIVGIAGTKGTTLIGNELPAKVMSNNSRWTNSFHPHDNRLEARGYAMNSFYEGLTMDAYFALAQAGRIGLIDTAVKTAKTGYMQRKMVKAQEDLIVNHDGSIRNQVGVIFSFSYGPNFSVSEMIQDNSDQGFSVFSFINIKELFGRINYENGFSNFDIKEEIDSLVNTLNKKYSFEEDTSEINIYNEDNETEEYLFGDYDDDEDDDDFDDDL